MSGRLISDWQMTRAACTDAVKVPCTVASALRESRGWRIGDQGAFDREDVVFRTQVEVDDETTLLFEGLTPACSIVVDDSVVAIADNMFLPVRVPVTRGSHAIELRFAPVDLSKKKPRARWRTRIFDDPQRRWIRATAIGHVPYLGPSYATVGPWRAVRLVRESIDNLVVTTSVDDTGRGVVRVRGVARSSLRATIGGMTVSAESGPFDVTLGIDDVDRWWPHTHGPQPMYELELDVAGEVQRLPLAFRVVELDDTMCVRVNGQAVFCRGVNWTPVDAYSMGGDSDAELARMVAAGFNMVRLTATSLYESDAFYARCTALGIMVWQDFQFSNFDYPFADAAFAESVTNEARTFLQRVAHEACVTVLCANAEVTMQAHLMGVQPPTEPFYETTLPELCAAVRPDVPFVPGSPSGGSIGIEPRAGCSHYYGVGAYQRPLADAVTSGVRFGSECLGFAMRPARESAEAWHDVPWESRYQRHESGAGDLADENEYYVRELFGVDPLSLRTSDRPAYNALLDITPGIVMEETFATWRSSDHCRGGLVWLWRDIWPSIGLGVIDGAGRTKAAYHYLRRACAPRAVFLRDAGMNGVDIHLINERPAPHAALLTLQLYRDDRLLETFTRDVSVSAASRVSLTAAELMGRFADVSFAFRFGPRPYDLIVARWGDNFPAFFFPGGQSLPRARDIGLTAERDGDHVRLTTRGHAHTVIIENAPLASDNYFHLAPGESRRVFIGMGPARISALSSLDVLRIT